MTKINFNNVREVRHSMKFRLSNDVWNQYRFNSSKNVGKLMHLINEINPNNMSEWIRGYFNSGKVYQDLLDNGEEPNPKQYGRTKHFLKKLASKFQKALLANCINVTFEEAYEYVLIRVLYETWIGYRRERKALEMLTKTFPECEVKHTSDKVDALMAVDYELFSHDGKRIVGIQVKGKHASKAVLEENCERNTMYTQEYGVGVVFAIIDGENIIIKTI